VQNSQLGYVLMATVGVEDEKVVFTSDVQGPMIKSTLDKILVEKPQLVIVGGPPTYLAGFRVKVENIKAGLDNLKKLTESVQTTILEHHTLRDSNWESVCQPIFDAAKNSGNRVCTAAEFVGKENNCLEFRRKQLFEIEPPGSDFEKWMKIPLQNRKTVKPPM
ncbi:MAG: hypothetical protein CW691_07025, partial [Candidatus Bathyarchaeum sp.]